MREHDYMDMKHLKEHLASLGYDINNRLVRTIRRLAKQGKIHTIKGTEWINMYNKAGGDPELPDLPFQHEMKADSYKVADVLSNLPK
jgi:hypothetical protein